MQFALITIVIVLSILCIAAVMLRKSSQQKKESFEDSAGDIYAMQSGASQYETITKLETDVKNLSVTTNNTSKDFNSFKDDANKRFGDIDTRTSQYQSDLNTKFSELQTLQNNDAKNLSVLQKGFESHGGEIKTVNDNIAIINGRIVDMNNTQQKLQSDLTTNVKTLTDGQRALDARINQSYSDVLGKVNTGFATLTNDVNVSLSKQTESVNALNKNLTSVSGNLTDFSSYQTKLSKEQQVALNDLKGQAISLQAAIELAQKRITEVGSLFGNYMKTSDMTNYASKNDLTAYANKNELGQYATKLDIANYISRNELSTYMPRREIDQTMQNVNSTLANMQKATTDISNTYAKKTELGQYATKQDMTNYVPRTELSAYMPKRDIDQAMLNVNNTLAAMQKTTSDISNTYAKKLDLDPLSKSLTDAMNALQQLNVTVGTIGANYVTKTELPKLALDATGMTTLSATLDGTKRAVADLSNSLSTLKGSLTNYVLTTDAANTYKTFALKTDLDPYMKKTDLPGALTDVKNSMSNYLLKTDAGQFATKTDLGNATASAKQLFPLKTDLDPYMKKADMPGALTDIKNSLNNYVLKTDVGQFATKNDLGNVTSPLATKASLDAVTKNLTDQIAAVKAGTTAILNTLEIKDVLKVNQIKAHPATYDKSFPAGWGGGVHTYDLYANATIAAGQNGGVNAYMNSGGEILGRRFKSIGDNNENNWNWMHVYRNDNDQLFFGGDQGNRGIWSHGPRDFSIYTSGANRMTVNKDGAFIVNGNPVYLNGKINPDRWSDFNYVKIGDGPEWNPSDNFDKTGTYINKDGQIRSRNTTEGDWVHKLYGREHRNVHLINNQGYGMHINTRNDEAGKYAIQTYNNNGETFRVTNDGKTLVPNKLGVGIDPNHEWLNNRQMFVNGGNPDWQTYFLNNNGNRHAVFNHGDGYGMHLNTNDQRGDRYAMQLWNGAFATKEVWNDGRQWNDSKRGDWQFQLRNMANDNAHRWISMNHGDGYGMSINTADQRADHYALQTTNGQGETFRVTNDGKTFVPYKLGVGIDPNHEWLNNKQVFVNGGNPDWQVQFYNNNGNRHALFNHGDGNGMHINTSDQRGDRYAMQITNGMFNPKEVWNDGRQWNDSKRGDWQFQMRNMANDNAHRWIHMNHGDGYGMHINTGDQRADHYALETHNGARVTHRLANDGGVYHAGHMGLENGTVIYNNGRQHIHGEELLFLLNKQGVIVSKAWGGNGKLVADGKIISPDIRAGPISENSKYPNGWSGGLMAMDVYANGSIAMGDLNGNVDRGMNRSGTWGLSDIRRKENVSKLTDKELDALNSLDPIKFTKKNDETKGVHFGYSAQDVEKVYPNLVTELPDGYKGLNYEEMIPLIAGNVKNIKKNIPNENTLCLGDVCLSKNELKKLKASIQ